MSHLAEPILASPDFCSEAGRSGSQRVGSRGGDKGAATCALVRAVRRLLRLARECSLCPNASRWQPYRVLCLVELPGLRGLGLDMPGTCTCQRLISAGIIAPNPQQIRQAEGSGFVSSGVGAAVRGFGASQVASVL